MFYLLHLFEFLRVGLDGLVKEEICCAKADTMSRSSVGRENLLEVLEGAVRSLAPGLREAQRDDIGVPAAETDKLLAESGDRPLPKPNLVNIVPASWGNNVIRTAEERTFFQPS